MERTYGSDAGLYTTVTQLHRPGEHGWGGLLQQQQGEGGDDGDAAAPAVALKLMRRGDQWERELRARGAIVPTLGPFEHHGGAGFVPGVAKIEVQPNMKSTVLQF